MAANPNIVVDVCSGAINDFEAVTHVQDLPEREKAQAESTQQLINALVLCAKDFETNEDTRKQVKALVDAYYAAMARLAPDAKGNVGGLRRSDFAVALDVFAKNRNLPEFNAIRGMMLYVDTLNSSAGWVRQDHTLAKRLFTIKFWSDNTLNGNDQKSKLLADIVEAFSIGFCDNLVKEKRKGLIESKAGEESGLYNSLRSMFFSGGVMTYQTKRDKALKDYSEAVNAYADYDATVNKDTVKVREGKLHELRRKIDEKKSMIVLATKGLELSIPDMQKDLGTEVQMNDQDYRDLAKNILKAEAEKEAKRAQQSSSSSESKSEEEEQFEAIKQAIIARGKSKSGKTADEQMVAKPRTKNGIVVPNSFSDDEDSDDEETSGQDGQPSDEKAEQSELASDKGFDFEVSEQDGQASDKETEQSHSEPVSPQRVVKAEESGTVYSVKHESMSYYVSEVAGAIKDKDFLQAEFYLQNTCDFLDLEDENTKEKYKIILQGLADQLSDAVVINQIDEKRMAVLAASNVKVASKHMRAAVSLLGDIKNKELGEQYQQRVLIESDELNKEFDERDRKVVEHIVEKITAATNTYGIADAKEYIQEAEVLLSSIKDEKLRGQYEQRVSNGSRELYEREWACKAIDALIINARNNPNAKVVRRDVEKSQDLPFYIDNENLRGDYRQKLSALSSELDKREDVGKTIDKTIRLAKSAGTKDEAREHMREAVNLLSVIEDEEVKKQYQQKLATVFKQSVESPFVNTIIFYLDGIRAEIKDGNFEEAKFYLELATVWLNNVPDYGSIPKVVYQEQLFELGFQLSKNIDCEEILHEMIPKGMEMITTAIAIDKPGNLQVAASNITRVRLLCTGIKDEELRNSYTGALDEINSVLEAKKRELAPPPKPVTGSHPGIFSNRGSQRSERSRGPVNSSSASLFSVFGSHKDSQRNTHSQGSVNSPSKSWFEKN